MGGGKGGKQTVGYQHFVGMHMVPCQGPIDAITRLTIGEDNRVAWEGFATGGQIVVNKPDLFGGKKREGGVSGTIDVMMGYPTQTKNDYLLSKIGPNIPAYRGVVSLVFRQCYMGNNPYLKPWRMRGQRIHVRQDGLPQWYDAKAGIASGTLTPNIGGQEVEVTWWQMSYYHATLQPNPDEARMGLSFLDADGLTIGAGITWSPYALTHNVWIERSLSVTAPAGAASIRVWQARLRHWGVNNDGYIDDITLTVDGQPVTLINPGAELSSGGSHPGWTTTSGGLNSSSPGHTGNRRFQGSGGYNEAYQSVLAPVDMSDMNPAHLIRECLTDPDWGMGYSEDDVDDDSFTLAADTLYSEGMGISMLWDKQITLESFIGDIVRHIDGALYVSRSTGKFVLKLTRADYDPDGLILLDESNIDKIESPTRPQFGELVNSVTVNFWNILTGKNDSLTVQDPAGVQMQGAVLNTSIRYDGFTNTRVASLVAARDLRALSNPFLSCTVYTTEEQAAELDIGSVFKMKWDKWQLAPTVMRVTGFAMSDGKTAQIRINCVEDVFSTPLNAIIVPPADEWIDPSAPPTPALLQAAFEIPYYELVQALGQATADSQLTENPDLGHVGAAAMRSNGSTVNASMWTDPGDGYDDAGTMDVCPGGSLAAAIGKTDTAISLIGFNDLDEVVLGSHAQLGTGPEAELVRVDAVDAETGAITVGRGVLDTVPHNWPVDTQMLFWDNSGGFDPADYVNGETVDVKVTPISGSGEVELEDAVAMEVVLDQRAYRPYPPGNLLIEGESYPVGAAYEDEITLAWAHRDRLLQTAGVLNDHFEGDIGPEAGTVYRISAYVDGVPDIVVDDIAGTTEDVVLGAEGIARIDVHSKRDGIYSTQAASVEFVYSSTDPRVTEDEDFRYTEEGDVRMTED